VSASALTCAGPGTTAGRAEPVNISETPSRVVY
jgi:hypothetical protein